MPASTRPLSSTRTPARMEDVARDAGVSLVTVSRAINTPERLAPGTLATVRAAIERLRYVPNLTAGSLASSRSQIIAAIVPTISNSIFSDTIDGLAQALAAQRYQLLLGQTHYREDEETRLIAAFLGRRVDGLVLTGIRHAQGVRTRLKRAGIPVVETWDLTPRPIDMVVGFSNHAAGYAAARYLAGKGYDSLGFIGGNDDRSAARLEGFRAGAGECGISSVRVQSVPSPSSVADGGRALGVLCTRAHPRAILCTNDMLAAGALFECQRRALPVPGRVALMGFADLPIAAGTEPPLTSVQVHSTEMGQRAGALLLSRLRGDGNVERIVDLGFSVVERAST